MAKKLLKVAGIIILLVVLGIAGLFGYVKYQQSTYALTAVPFIKEVIPKITRWDPNEIKPYLSPEALSATSDADLTKMFSWFAKLGALKTVGEPVFQNVFAGSQKIITYSVPTTFEAGEALIVFRLVDLGTEFKILSFNINSKALMG
jgi:hypothetical protein